MFGIQTHFCFLPKNSQNLTFLWDPGADHCAAHTVRLPAYGTLFKFALHFPPSSPNDKTQGTSFPFTQLLSTPKPTDHRCSELLHPLFSVPPPWDPDPSASPLFVPDNEPSILRSPLRRSYSAVLRHTFAPETEPRHPPSLFCSARVIGGG